MELESDQLEYIESSIDKTEELKLNYSLFNQYMDAGIDTETTLLSLGFDSIDSIVEFGKKFGLAPIK